MITFASVYREYFSKWSEFFVRRSKTRCSTRFCFGPLSQIYIDFSGHLSFTCKIFVDDTFTLFSFAHDKYLQLNNDRKKSLLLDLVNGK